MAQAVRRTGGPGPARAPETFIAPKTLGAAADLLYQVRQARLALQRQVDEMQAKETAISDHIIATLPKTDGGAIGKIASVTVETRLVPRVSDWDQLYKYVLKTKDFSLLQKRLGEGAVSERWDAGKSVPGVEPFSLVRVSLKKKV